ncbi:MAG: substrate-binding domain-containing protein, partial [Elusimicrobiota bacterium]
TLDEVRDIFARKITRWDQVGGPAKPIVIVGRESADAGVAVMFDEMVMKGTPISSRRLSVLSSSEIEQEIENNPYGIAVTGISAKAREVKLLSIGGVPPDRAHFRDGSYPLARPLYLVTKGEPAGDTKDFIDFVLSKEGQQIMGKNAIAIRDWAVRSKNSGAIAAPIAKEEKLRAGSERRKRKTPSLKQKQRAKKRGRQ